MSQIVANYPVTGASPSSVSGPSTGVLYFPNPQSVLPQSIFAAPPDRPFSQAQTTAPSQICAAGQLGVPGSNRLNGQPFHVIAGGDFRVGLGAGSSTVQVILSANIGTLLTPTYFVIAESTGYFAEALNNVYYPWSMDVTVTGSTASGIVQGQQTWLIDNTVNVNGIPLTHVLTDINFGTEPPFGLVIGIQFGTSEFGNAANCYRYSLEA